MKNKFRTGIIGIPIKHSLSPTIHNYWMDLHNIASAYNIYELEKQEVPMFIKNMPTNNIKGLNVTIPYKEGIIPYLDELSEDAKIIGAVNTIRFLPNGKAEGHNTDAYGFKAALLKQWGNHATKALILGTGGASKAIKYVLEQKNIEPLFVSRNPKEGQIGYEQIDSDLMQAHLLIINCTPLGTHPEVNKAPAIPYESISSKHFLFDLIYNPELTLFLKEGKKKGATTQNGLFMLEQQAEKSWNIWNDVAD